MYSNTHNAYGTATSTLQHLTRTRQKKMPREINNKSQCPTCNKTCRTVHELTNRISIPIYRNVNRAKETRQHVKNGWKQYIKLHNLAHRYKWREKHPTNPQNTKHIYNIYAQGGTTNPHAIALRKRRRSHQNTIIETPDNTESAEKNQRKRICLSKYIRVGRRQKYKNPQNDT